MDAIKPFADKIEQLYIEGQLKNIVIAAGIAILSVILITIIAAYLIKRHHESIISHQAVHDAIRISEFYLDRPLPAEICIKYKTLRERRNALKQEYPACDPKSLAKAVWEAEYNEFVVWELDGEIRDLKKRYAKAPRGAIRLALKELDETKLRMPHGITAIFRTRHTRREFNYLLAYAHRWLDHVDENTKIRASEKYQAIRANKFKCAWCNADWNDGARITVVKTKSGALAPICLRCKVKHEE